MKLNRLILPAILLVTACGNDTDTIVNDDPIFREPAIVKVTEEIKKDPDNARLYFERAVMLDGMESDSLALVDYKKAISLDSTRAEYYSAIGDMLFEHKDMEGSVKWIGKALELNPKDRKSHLKLAKMYLFIEDYSKALSEINLVLRQDVYDPEGYYLKGMVYKSLKDTTRALSSFQTALQVEPSYREAMIQLGIVYGMQANPLALQYYDNAFKLDTTDVFPIYARGVYFQDKGDYELAKNEYISAILKDRFYTSSYYNLGYIYMQQDSLQKAFRQYDILTKLDPRDPEAYFNRGLCYELMGKKEEAIIDYKQSLVFDESYEDPKEGLKRLAGK
ncbi:MAG: tetratricopeptide repeat protein [Chitinophagales bacterium]|nr:tetratricopeptide repeat protein [Chitinophagales bacterium]